MRLLLVGYYGYGNLGDELLAAATRRIVAAIPARVELLTPRLRQPLRLLNAVRSCDGLVFGGGSLFQDITGRGLTVLYYVGIAWLGHLLHKKLFFIGQGLGPIRRPWNRFCLRYILRRAAFISLRNRESLAFVQALGVRDAVLANDLLFAETLPPVKKKPSRKMKIVLSFRPGISVAVLTELCRRLSATYALVLVPLQRQVDEALIRPLAAFARIVPYDPDKIIREIATADFAVGMRLHFLLLAACYTVPFVGIAYDPKVEGLCKRLQMPQVSVHTAAALPHILPGELSKAAYYRRQLSAVLERERDIARNHVLQIQEAIRHALG